MSNAKNPVLHLVPALEIGGMERMVASLTLQHPNSSRVLCLEQFGQLGQSLLKQGVAIDVLRAASHRVTTILRLRRYLVEHQIRILHAHNLKAFTYAAAVAPLVSGVRLVLTKHGMRLPQKRGLGERLRRLTAHRSALVGVSREICAQLQSWAKLGPERVSLIENGTPWQSPSASREQLRERLGFAANSVVLACVARLAPEKDHETLLRAFQSLLVSPKLNHDLRLLLVGDGPLRESLRTLTEQLNVSAQVDFLGERDDVADIFAAADIAVLSSRTEGLPLTLLEAMMQRTPVVATAVGDIPALVNRDAGRLVPPGSPTELTDAILHSILDKHQSEKMANQAFQRVQGRYSIDATWQKYQTLYQSLEAN